MRNYKVLPVAFPHQKNQVTLKSRKALSCQGWEAVSICRTSDSPGWQETRTYLTWCRLRQAGQALAEGNGDADVSRWLSENLVACQE